MIRMHNNCGYRHRLCGTEKLPRIIYHIKIIDNITDVQKFMEECKSMKIKVKGPDVNES